MNNMLEEAFVRIKEISDELKAKQDPRLTWEFQVVYWQGVQIGAADTYEEALRKVAFHLFIEENVPRHKNKREEAMDLDELQAETEKLLALLKDRQRGLFSWNMLLAERCKAIAEMFEKAGL